MSDPGEQQPQCCSSPKGPKRKQMADGNAAKEEKQRKWLAKQTKKQKLNQSQQDREKWFQMNSDYAVHVTLEDLEKLEKAGEKSPASSLALPLASLLEPYRNIQDGSLSNGSTQRERYFIAEGTETVRLLIQQFSRADQQRRRIPPVQLRSVFIKTSAFFERPVLLQKDIEEAVVKSSKNNQKPFQVIVGSEELQSQVVGFSFCRGALACGVIPPWTQDEDWLMEYLRRHPRFLRFNDVSVTSEKAAAMSQQSSEPLRLLALDGICDTANLGSMVRSASAFGVDAILLSKDCCDAWYRRSVRVSMGHCCRVPCVRVSDLVQTLNRMQTELGVTSYAAVIDRDAECVLEKIERGQVPGAWCCVMGNEGNGISKPVARVCSTRLRIDMEDGVDSLSVPIATAILLHGLNEREMK